MMGIPRDTKRITYSSEIRAMKHVSLSEEQRAVVVGSLLGDANLCGNWSETNYRLQIRHSEKQSEYVAWKYQQLQSIVLTPPKLYEKTRCVHFRTVSHPTLTNIHSMFYQEGKKIISPKICEQLSNPLVIAVWFMDDGNARIENEKLYGFHLNTQSFTENENMLLAEALNKNWGIECRLHKNKKHKRLYIGGMKNYSNFRRVIRPYILPSLAYKLG
jgi:hypothetical protein